MDGIDLDQRELLIYGKEEENHDEDDISVMSRKRLASSSDEATSIKRSRVQECKKLTDAQQAQSDSNVFTISVSDDDDSDGDLVTVFDEHEIIIDATARVNSPSKPDDRKSLSNWSGDGANRAATVTPDVKFGNPRFSRVLKEMPQDIPCLPVTCDDGTRLYLRLSKKQLQKDDGEISTIPDRRFPTMGLVENWDAVKSSARAITNRSHTTLAKTVNDEIIEVSDSRENGVAGSLWVEKYKPRSFLDLLSMEAVNRGLLHWLKLWDKSVFGIDYLAKVKANRKKHAKLEAAEKKMDEKYHRKTFMPEDEGYDERGKPKLKVALLAGDPGMGKTTCAHVIARHAGYRIKEINASDDRSTVAFRKALNDTEERTDILVTDGRPKCLIIDEIDGAPAASLKVLVDYVLGNASEKGKRKKKCLLRPIICICNNLFATSLKDLRKHAFVIQFPKIHMSRLVERLHEVSINEQLNIDKKTLQALCQRLDCDIRSCLSTLQFLKKGLCTPKQVLEKIGAQDTAKGIYRVWQDIFTLPPEERYQDAHRYSSKSEMRFSKTLQLVQNHGEYGKLFNGVFENNLRIKNGDIYMQSVIDGLDWAVWFELIQDYISRSQNYSIYGLLPMYFIKAHFLYARKDPIKLEFQTNDIEYRISRICSTIKSQIKETQQNVARFLDPYMLIIDTYPAIIRIIQPCDIRPVSQIWNQRERDTFKNIVEVMITHNLTYIQTRNPLTGAYSFLLDPCIDDIVTFKCDDGSNTSGRKPFPYVIRQLVAREINMEKMKRNDTIPEIVRRDTFKVPQIKSASISATATTCKSAKSPSIIGRDIFGRPILPSEETLLEAQCKKKRTGSVYFRFKEGYSNAVRRYIKMKDL